MKESTPSLDIGSELKRIIKLIDGNGEYFTDKFIKFSKEDDDNNEE